MLSEMAGVFRLRQNTARSTTEARRQAVGIRIAARPRRLML